MLRWLPSDVGLDTIGTEAAHAREAARLARLAGPGTTAAPREGRIAPRHRRRA
jgi:hypothetical protein